MHNVCTKEIKKITLSSNDDKIMQLIDSIETYPWELNKNLLCKKEETECNKIIKQYENV